MVSETADVQLERILSGDGDRSRGRTADARVVLPRITTHLIRSTGSDNR
jgi:hypothetical protein